MQLMWLKQMRPADTVSQVPVHCMRVYIFDVFIFRPETLHIIVVLWLLSTNW